MHSTCCAFIYHQPETPCL
ncbi:TPA: cyclic lactone autoinducer peptide [Escherichia coli]|nr:hypothetical protein DEF50_01320 [Escherichia coli]EEZ9868386.1 cyclic lactone autoinducer peptide [Escherichia coli O10]EHD3363970.1 cyclic lactone autoinducer peptide [Escherichia coli O124]EHD3420484.1 cyclic lactone autoinducer peptide [Escherichia coli O167]EIH0319667.1 cyclic lactone autoinducer peptide [Escherichia coli O112]EIH1070857.1 cyclic lactone autoinducer peptide [Escherichia coli O7:H18]MXC79821.1 cyclic lactone autoinducer peptide [Escherichia sp. HH26CH]